MFAGALSAARELGAVPFYFDSRNRYVTFIDSLRREKIKPINAVDVFLRLNSDGLYVPEVTDFQGMSPERQRLTKTLWIYRAKIARLYKELSAYNKAFQPFKVARDGLVIELNSDKVAKFKGYGLDFVFYDWPDFAKYISGGWFEDYVYLQCKPYEDSGVIKDLRLNVKLKFEEQNSFSHPTAGVDFNELDIAFTDGYSLYIVECKAGNVTQDHVMKLQNLVRFYGGVEGRGILASCFPPNAESVKKKIQDARLMPWSGGLFLEQLKALMGSIATRTESMAIAT